MATVYYTATSLDGVIADSEATLSAGCSSTT